MFRSLLFAVPFFVFSFGAAAEPLVLVGVTTCPAGWKKVVEGHIPLSYTVATSNYVNGSVSVGQHCVAGSSGKPTDWLCVACILDTPAGG